METKWTVAGKELAWHALELQFQCQTLPIRVWTEQTDVQVSCSGPLLCVNSPREMKKVRMAVRFQFGIHVVAQRQGSRYPLWRSAHGYG